MVDLLINDFVGGGNERIFFSFVCQMMQMNAQKCYRMLTKMQKSLLNLIHAQTFIFFVLINVSLRYWLPFHSN